MSAVPPIATIQGYESELTLWAKKQTDAPQQEYTSTICLYTKALSPVMALPTIKVFISRVPS